MKGKWYSKYIGKKFNIQLQELRPELHGVWTFDGAAYDDFKKSAPIQYTFTRDYSTLILDYKSAKQVFASGEV